MRKALFFAAAILLAACNYPVPTPVSVTQPVVETTLSPVVLPTQAASPTIQATATSLPVEVPTATAILPLITDTNVPTPEASSTPPPSSTMQPTVPASEFPEQVGEEAILILSPGPGSRVTSPIRVSGIANPTFEQTLGVKLVLDDGTQVALGPAYINADVGERGPFEVDVPFQVDEERQGFIQVFATSARDGGITHLASVGVTLAPSGSADIKTVTSHPERISIFQPENNATVTGGTAHVEGFALASFEQTLLVQVQDESGNAVGSESVIVQAPDVGQPGPFRVDVPYSVDSSGPGRIAVIDVSPAFGGDTHLASVEITLEP